MNFSTLQDLSLIHETTKKTVPPDPASPPDRIKTDRVCMPEGGKPASSRIYRNCCRRRGRFVSVVGRRPVPNQTRSYLRKAPRDAAASKLFRAVPVAESEESGVLWMISLGIY